MQTQNNKIRIKWTKHSTWQYIPFLPDGSSMTSIGSIPIKRKY